MEITPYFRPYIAPRKTRLKAQIAGRSGVYLIYRVKRSKNGATARKLVYIGHSTTNLYKTLYRHYQSWDDPTQTRVTYSQTGNTEVRIIFAPPALAQKLEKYLIVKQKPTDNPAKYLGYTGKLTPAEAAALTGARRIPKTDKSVFVTSAEFPKAPF